MAVVGSASLICTYTRSSGLVVSMEMDPRLVVSMETDPRLVVSMVTVKCAFVQAPTGISWQLSWHRA